MTTEQAFGTIEAFVSGGDELGIVSEESACEAIRALRERIETLEAWKSAVPVESLRFEYANSIALSVTGYEMDDDAFNAACIEINEWLKTVQP